MIGSHDDTSSVPFDVDTRVGVDVLDTELLDEGEDTLMLNSPLVEELSDPYVGNWNKLVSQTNWEKGRVIQKWRESMIAAELPKSAYSDEAWARRVGNVTPQHVGRLRRVAERFEGKAEAYPKLFWSHFYAALDWEDAELWLEGATQNAWSVAQMKIQRWEAIGAPEELKPRDEDIFTAEWEDDSDSDRGKRTEPRTAEIGGADIVEGFDPDAAPFEGDDTPKDTKKPKNKAATPTDGPTTGDLLVTLQDFSDFPEDLADALETLKVAVLNHKLGGWKEVAPQKLISRIDALKALVTAVDE